MERPDSEFKAINASVRPARVTTLVGKDDENWQDTCLRIIEFYSRLWGGAYNLIVPTDGRNIDDRFWTILETFDPDYVYSYRKSGEDLSLSSPEHYEQILQAHVTDWLSQAGSADPESARREIDRDLRRSAVVSDFGIAAALQAEIKTRLAPFYFERWIVDAGAVTANQEPMFPLADLTKIILNTEHPDTVAIVEEPTNQIPRIWYSAVCGRLSPSASQVFKEIGITPTEFVFGPENHSQLVELTVTGAIRRPRVFSSEALFHQLDGILPYQLSMLQLGLYRSVKYVGYNEPMLIVAGNTFEDFCLYYCLSRLRDRVAWMLPSITAKALAGC